MSDAATTTVSAIPLIIWASSTVVSIIAGILIYRDAKSRDYNPFVWGLLFPLLALLSFGNPVQIVIILIGIPAYLLLRPKGEIKICPHCSRKYIDELAFCPHCKKEVKKECLRCHDLADLDAARCPHCGAPMIKFEGRASQS